MIDFRHTTRPDLADIRVSVRWLNRSGQRELEVRAPAPEQLFAAAAVAVGTSLDDRCKADEPDRLPVLLTAPDLSALLAAFLDDILYLASVEGFVGHSVERLEIRELRLRAALTGATCSAPPSVPTIHTVSVERDAAFATWVALIALGCYRGAGQPTKRHDAK